MIVVENGKRYVVSVKENGDKFWYLNDKLHRESGPAIELASGSKAYYLDGIKILSEKEFQKRLLVKNAEANKYYDIKVEVMLPATLHYRVLAKSPEEAVKLLKNLQPNAVKHKLIGRKEIKLYVYEAGTSLIKFIKNLI